MSAVSTFQVNLGPRHHSIVRVRFYAFFFPPDRIRTVQDRFSSLTIARPCRRLHCLHRSRSPHQATLMRTTVIFAVAALFFLVSRAALLAQAGMSSVLVFSESGFPTANSAAPSPQQLAAIFPGAQLAGADHRSE